MSQAMIFPDISTKSGLEPVTEYTVESIRRKHAFYIPRNILHKFVSRKYSLYGLTCDKKKGQLHKQKAFSQE